MAPLIDGMWRFCHSWTWLFAVDVAKFVVPVAQALSGLVQVVGVTDVYPGTETSVNNVGGFGTDLLTVKSPTP